MPSKHGTLKPSRGESQRADRGSTLLLSLFLIFILTMLAMGLLSRASMVHKIAGSERWSERAFYGAEAGLEFSLQRSRVLRFEGFDFGMNQMKHSDSYDESDYVVRVNEVTRIGSPQPDSGSMLGGGQGGSEEMLYLVSQTCEATASQDLVRAERTVSNIFVMGPMPLDIALYMVGAQNNGG